MKMRTAQEMLALLMKTAQEDERIRAVYLHGSRANPKVEKDKYTDFDIVFVVNETASFLKDKDWIHQWGEVLYVMEGYRNENDFHKKAINDFSRSYVWCLLLKDGNRLDIIIEIKEEAMKHKHIVGRPTQILLDKDGILPDNRPAVGEACAAAPPDEAQYVACCSAFWWFLNDTAKAMARDQLPYAKELFTSFNRYTLNQMIDWLIGIQTHFTASTGQHGRYYKKYLPEPLYDLYVKTYADGHYEHFWEAIFATGELFSQTASAVGEAAGFTYNHTQEMVMLDYLTKIRNGMKQDERV